MLETGKGILMEGIKFIRLEDVKFTHDFFARRTREPECREVFGEKIVIDGQGWFSNDPAISSSFGRLKVKEGKNLFRTQVRSNDNNNNAQDVYVFHPENLKVVSVWDNVGNYHAFVMSDNEGQLNAEAITGWLQFLYFRDHVPATIDGLNVAEILARKKIFAEDLEVIGFYCLPWELGARLKLLFPKNKVVMVAHGYARGGDPGRREITLPEAESINRIRDVPRTHSLGQMHKWMREEFMSKNDTGDDFSFLL
jgi:hypothetical protein